ncbi:MAG: hypothetical protein ACE5QV_05005 [Fidelibacterota bacterium]
MNYRGLISIIFAAVVLLPSTSPADDPPGKVLHKALGREDRKEGLHNGNKVRTLFYNFGTIGHPDKEPSGEWPIYSGHGYIDEFGFMVAAQVVDTSGNVVHIVSDGILNHGEAEEYAKMPWNFEPLPGYANPDQDYIAMSDKPKTWPDHWPNRPDTWDGYWIGEYGLGVIRADQESYYVMDDRYNSEFAFFPDSTDSTRRGLGIRVEARGYQWAHPLAEDCIFWIYEISNVSTTDYDSIYFIGYGDPHPGGGNDYTDDDSYFDKFLDITYTWDHDNRGDWGGPVGYMGWKFLESPGNPWDGVDNDDDGLVDERRDSGPGEWVFGPIGIYGDPKWHWSGDEDGDWESFIDENGNGVWDEGEPLNDDLGADGIGPEDEAYPGPDEGQGDGIPTDGEPDFDDKDINEADQLGLTGFNTTIWGTIYAADDEKIWQRVHPPGNFSEIAQNTDNLFLYSSGPFPLPVGKTQRFSMAFLFGEDQQDLMRNAVVVQQIYNNNYSFAKPPKKPKLTAVPGDKKVTLYWDIRAERSEDPIYGRDFEGYMIYRSTDPGFNEIGVITDSYGNKIFNKPMAQFDLIDGLKGPHPIGLGEEVEEPSGAHMNMGDDTGLAHSWVDTTVENGQTYYYAVVSYDKGYDIDFYERGISDQENLQPISPSTSTATIDVDLAGNIIFIDINCAKVVPNAPAAGFKTAEIEGEIKHVDGHGTGKIWIDILDPMAVKEGNQYRVIFDDTTSAALTYNLYDLTASRTIFANSELINGEDYNPVFDGMRLFVQNEVTIAPIDSLTGWISGDCNFEVDVKPYDVALPKDFEIVFSDTIVSTDIRNTPAPFEVWNITDAVPADFAFYDLNRDSSVSSGEQIIPVIYEDGRPKATWVFTFSAPETIQAVPPGEGDVLRLQVTKPFKSGDVFQFETKAAHIEEERARYEMDRIAVVPNPYVVTASWEPRHIFTSGRGERKIDFIHLPKRPPFVFLQLAAIWLIQLNMTAPLLMGLNPGT